jgi:hypothetical protein
MPRVPADHSLLPSVLDRLLDQEPRSSAEAPPAPRGGEGRPGAAQPPVLVFMSHHFLPVDAVVPCAVWAM